MADRAKLAAVPFVNAWPLVHGLDGRPDVELRTAAPPEIAPMLMAGDAEAALLPTVDYLRLATPSQERARTGAPRRLVILPVGAIGSRGPVGSLRLFGYAEIKALRRVRLDPASRTSNAMVRVWLAQRPGLEPHYVVAAEDRSGARPADAELVIGDAGLVAERPAADWVLDMGEVWDATFHRPFVYAVWAARADAPLERLTEVLAEARDAGLAARDALAGRAEAERGIPADVARRYLTEQVRYAFGPDEMAGLAAFADLAAEEGLVGAGAELVLAAV